MHHLVQELLKRVDILPWDSDVAKTYGVVRAKMEQSGLVLDSMDLLIAAHALQTHKVLVTHDQAFRKVPGLMVEDWL